MKERNVLFVLGGIAGLAAGFGLGSVCELLSKDAEGSTISTFDYHGAKVLRENRVEERDSIYIEAEPGNYVRLTDYLSNIENGYDRKITETEIEKLVDW